MSDRCFIDSNVWIYLLSDDEPAKKECARRVLAELTETSSKVVSWQVVNEVCANLLRKKGKDESFVRMVIDFICGSCEVVEVAVPTVMAASDLRGRHSVSFWDSLVVAAALEAGCDALVSEDMQDGKMFGQLRVKNIFG
jgi:predicted nucleic acid-binding protein